MKPRLSIGCLVLLLFFLKTSHAFGQQIIFNKVLPPEGTNFNLVTGIAQDVNGFMWFTTNQGLYSYDGYQMKSYTKDSLNSNSICNNRLESILGDSMGNVWIGSFGSGLDQLDLTSGIFTHFRHNANDPNSISNDTVTVILRDKEGILWIGTFNGLNQFNSKTKTFIHYRYNANDPASISNNLVRSIYEDRLGTLWIGTGSPFPNDGGGPEAGGLNRLNKKKGVFTRFLHDENNIHSLANNKVKAIFEDNLGVLWIGTAGNVIHKMNRQQGSFERIIYDSTHPEKLSGPALKKESSISEHISFITQDATGSYWIGANEGGINYFNSRIGKIIHYDATNNSSGFTDNGTWSVFTSREGTLWISSNWNNEGNLYRINPFRKEFRHTKMSCWVNCFYEEPNGILWMGTSNGLLRKNPNTQQEKYWSHDSKNKTSLSDDQVVAIRPDVNGNLWLATHLGGLDRFDPKTEIFTHYKYDEKNPESLVHDTTHCLFFDNQKMLWIGTHKGLSRMDIKTGLCTNYTYNSKDSLTLSNGQTYGFVQEKNAMIWIATDGGISRFDSKSGKFHRYLKDNPIKAVCIDTDGIIWAGGDNGFYYFDSKKNNFINYSNPMFRNDITRVLAIAEDDKKNLWINTASTLIRVNAKRDELKVYTSLNGILPCNDCMWRESYKTKDGRLFMGSDIGYYSFDPDEMNETSTAPLLHLILSIGNKAIYTGLGSAMSPPLWENEKIILNYNQNTFSFDFNAFDFKTPGNIKYLCLLENYDKAWLDIGTGHKVTFFNIPPGKYIFRVKAINSEGTATEKSIIVIINPPWWRSWWAFCIYGLIVAASVMIAFRYQKHRIVQAERLRTQKRELEHAKEIEKAYTELKATQTQLIQSEKMASLGELTAGIAHEIQNPLNFINNFSEVNKELLLEMKDEMNKGNLENANTLVNDVIGNEEKINHHGKRADAIVKGMLQHSRKSTGIKEPTDINQLADEYFRLSYHGMRAKDKTFHATMKTDFDTSIEKINVIPQDLGRAILNLINNAFYAVSEKKSSFAHLPNDALAKLGSMDDKYEPTVSISTKKIGNKILISVKDNGNGIPLKVLDKIFQPFFTTKPTGQGTGLGLSLSYDIVKAHGGELKVQTKEADGSEFIIQLPV